MSRLARWLLAAWAEAMLALAAMWGSLHLASLSRVVGAWNSEVETGAYILFLLFLGLLAAALVALLAASGRARTVVWLAAAVLAGFAAILTTLGLFMAIWKLTGPPGDRSWGHVAIGVAAALAAHYAVVRHAGLGARWAIPGSVLLLLMIPAMAIGAFAYCVTFTPTVRCF